MSDPRLETMSAVAEGPATRPSQAIPEPVSQKPTLLAIDFSQKAVITTVGIAPLTDKEMKAVHGPAMAAFGRMLDSVLTTVGASVRLKRRGRKPGRPRAASAASATGKRRGRPPKARPTPQEAAPSVSA